MPDPSPATCGVYKPRCPQASPLFRLVSDHRQRLQTVDDDRFARDYGPWRPVVAQVADQFLATVPHRQVVRTIPKRLETYRGAEMSNAARGDVSIVCRHLNARVRCRHPVPQDVAIERGPSGPGAKRRPTASHQAR